ncbi:Gfo/Idh/MocA family protein [Sphingomonas gei]|nr:Gfo/Idh/MocA family oxidoreductase [Sphingomonas gei]
MSHPRRYLISSLGSIGHRHLQNLISLRPGSRIAVLRRPDSVAKPLPPGVAQQFETMEEALAFQPEAAILAGPAPTHVPLALALVGQSIPIFMEKPLSHDFARVAELRDLAAARNVPVMVGYNLRFNPSLITFRELVHSEALGTIRAVRAEVGQFLPDWRPRADYRHSVSASQSLGGGVLLELSHEIDYIYWLFGMPDRVSCRGGRYSDLDIDVEDLVELCLEYSAPRRLVSIHLDFLQRTATRSCKVIGAMGVATWDAMKDRIELDIVAPERRVETIARPMQERNEMYLAELRTFLLSAEQGGATAIPLDQAIDVLAIVMAAKRAMVSGRPETPSTIEVVR